MYPEPKIRHGSHGFHNTCNTNWSSWSSNKLHSSLWCCATQCRHVIHSLCNKLMQWRHVQPCSSYPWWACCQGFDSSQPAIHLLLSPSLAYFLVNIRGSHTLDFRGTRPSTTFLPKMPTSKKISPKVFVFRHHHNPNAAWFLEYDNFSASSIKQIVARI